MAAADRLLQRLIVLDEAVDYCGSNPTLPQSVRDHALRGVAIQGLSAFEQFVRERGDEWVSHMTSARIPATHLAGGTVPYSDQIISNLPRRLKGLDDGKRATLVEELAETLTSFSTGTVVGHNLLFAWGGSNIQISDAEAMIKLVGIARGWNALTAAWKLLDPRFPGNASANSTMTSFASLRHTLAHNVDATVDPLSVSAVTRNVRLTALLFDMCVSEALAHICHGEAVPSTLGSTFKVRAIRRDGNLWPEYPPNSTRAFRRHASLPLAISESLSRSRPRKEVVVAYDANEIVDWRAAL
jgi:hypothetical protein